jgi:hypothetical protein
MGKLLLETWLSLGQHLFPKAGEFGKRSGGEAGDRAPVGLVRFGPRTPESSFKLLVLITKMITEEPSSSVVCSALELCL